MKILSEEVYSVYESQKVKKEEVKKQEPEKFEVNEKIPETDKIRLEKLKILSKVKSELKLEKPEEIEEMLDKIRELGKNKDMSELIDKEYLQYNKKNLYFSLTEDNEETKVEKISKKDLETRIRKELQNLEPDGKSELLKNKLKTFLNSIDEIPEGEKLDNFKSILLHGFMINLENFKESK